MHSAKTWSENWGYYSAEGSGEDDGGGRPWGSHMVTQDLLDMVTEGAGEEAEEGGEHDDEHDIPVTQTTDGMHWDLPRGESRASLRPEDHHRGHSRAASRASRPGTVPAEPEPPAPTFAVYGRLTPEDVYRVNQVQLHHNRENVRQSSVDTSGSMVNELGLAPSMYRPQSREYGSRPYTLELFGGSHRRKSTQVTKGIVY